MATREEAIAAIAARLAAQVPTATVERARRAPVELENETLPRLVLAGTDWSADETAEPLIVHYTLSFTVTGYVMARSDLLTEQALGALHALVVAALSGWTPATAGLAVPVEEGAEFGLYDTEDSTKPAGDFTARFSMLCLATIGNG